MHICISKITIIGSDNGLSPGRRQAIIWTSVGILLIGPLGTNFSAILIEIYTFSFKKMHFKMSSGKWRPFRLGLNVLIQLEIIYLHFHSNLPPANELKIQKDHYWNVHVSYNMFSEKSHFKSEKWLIFNSQNPVNIGSVYSLSNHRTKH